MRLRLVIVSFVDDNFGDNLIRISFQALLEVALRNHRLAPEDYEICPMSLKHVDEELIEGADTVFFAGGGLFGVSYLDFFRFVDQITAIADRRGIPVVFSSMGLNNMAADGGNVDAIKEIAKRGCVKAISVRENLSLFQELDAALPFEVSQVADPAVWTKYVYGMMDATSDGTVGINVVRGGLFAANDLNWGLTAEMKYLAGLMEHAAESDSTVQLYTNGSLDDNNTLRFFAKKYAIPSDRIVLPQTTREVIEAIASCSAIASMRMHSSIIAYSFGIPTVALAWNEKIPHFYEAIGHPERVIPFGEWSSERSFAVLSGAGIAPERDPGYRKYLMSTYAYIHGTIGEHLLTNRPGAEPAYEFEDVALALIRRSSSIDEDENDLRFKLEKTERAYLNRFVTIRDNEKVIGVLTKQVDALSEENRVLRDSADTS